MERLIELIGEAFVQSGGDMYAGRQLLELLRTVDIDGNVRAEVVALPSGHPYLRVPLQFATALERKLLTMVTAEELEQLRKDATAELRGARALGHDIHAVAELGPAREIASVTGVMTLR